MSKDKYKHAMEVIENWERVEIGFGYPERSWNEAKQSPDSFTLSQLNDRALFRIKPTPSKVPFGPEDITSDMWFAVNATHHKWLKASSLYSDGIALPIHAFVNYQQLREQFVYRRDGWEMNRTEKCEKPSLPPPKREPRRVWVNMYPSELYPKELGMACVAHFSETDAKAYSSGKPLESAVEFVEVVKL